MSAPGDQGFREVALFKWVLQDPDEYDVGHCHVMTACSFDVSGAADVQF